MDQFCYTRDHARRMAQSAGRGHLARGLKQSARTRAKYSFLGQRGTWCVARSSNGSIRAMPISSCLVPPAKLSLLANHTPDASASARSSTGERKEMSLRHRREKRLSPLSLSRRTHSSRNLLDVNHFYACSSARLPTARWSRMPACVRHPLGRMRVQYGKPARLHRRNVDMSTVPHALTSIAIQ